MSQQTTTLEVIAPTVEEAVQKGLQQLNLPAEAVDVEVLDSGSRGLFGIGSRQARVRVLVKDTQAPVFTPAQVPTSEPASSSPTAAVSTDGEAIEGARQVVEELLQAMQVGASVTAVMRPALDEHDEDTVLVNIEGDDLSILIGRRSETLNALQYISSLILGKRLNRWVPMMIDVQGYRARRDRQLRVLARRMAEQAVHTGKRQVLEPMPANERRVIHLELRDHPMVDTESIGDEPNRKVTISLKK